MVTFHKVKGFYTRGRAKAALADHTGAIADFACVIAIKSDHALAYYAQGLAKSAEIRRNTLSNTPSKTPLSNTPRQRGRMWDCYALKCKLIFGLYYKRRESEFPPTIVVSYHFSVFGGKGCRLSVVGKEVSDEPMLSC